MPRNEARRRQPDHRYRAEVAELVQLLQTERGWGPGQLASRLGSKSKTTAQRIQNGEVPITIGLLVDLSKAFDRDVQDLLAPLLGGASVKDARIQAAARIEAELLREFGEAVLHDPTRRRIINRLADLTDQQASVIADMIDGLTHQSLRRRRAYGPLLDLAPPDAGLTGLGAFSGQRGGPGRGEVQATDEYLTARFSALLAAGKVTLADLRLSNPYMPADWTPPDHPKPSRRNRRKSKG